MSAETSVPYHLGRILAAGNRRGSTGGQLVAVEVHRGLPSSSKDSVGYGANRRQSAAWEKEAPGVVTSRPRPLRYPGKWNPGGVPVEKGIDVQLALSAVEHVLLGVCDVAVIFSHDTDLLPAVETLARTNGATSVETASWSSHSYRRRLQPVPGVHHHTISGEVFGRIETPINYAYKGPPK